MIITRYLLKEICNTAAASTVVLLMIFLCTQFVHYLSAAAGGKYTTLFLLQIMLLQVPYLLGLLLPLGFFVAILMAYGRLHLDREMAVLFSCGMRPVRLLGVTMGMALIVTGAVAVLSLWLSPYVASEQKRLVAEAKAAPVFETMFPGRFFSLNGGKSVLYIENVARGHQNFEHIFFAQLSQGEEENMNANAAQRKAKHSKPVWSVLTAENGQQIQISDPTHEYHYLEVFNGNRYTGLPGNQDFHAEAFSKLRISLNARPQILEERFDTLSSFTLWKQRHQDPGNAAELHWRLAMPITVLLLTLFAVPMSKINPRQGKYAQLIPALLIYILYANMLFVGRDWLKDGIVPQALGLWWLHALFLLFACGILFWQSSWKQQLMRYFYENRHLVSH